MHKTLIVAHPDDEMLWFNPLSFDKIIICFQHRADKKEMGKQRSNVLNKHPLKNKIECLGLMESGYYNCEKRKRQHIKSYKDVCHELKRFKGTDIVYTHNSWGEYGHPDHILVHEAVREIFNGKEIICPDIFVKVMQTRPVTTKDTFEEEIDIEFYKGLKELYKKEKCWTWFDAYVPDKVIKYYKL